MQLRVIIADQTGTKKTPVELPDDVPMKRLIPAIVTKMSLPTSVNRNPLVWVLVHNKSGRRLEDDDTLQSAGVAQDDLLTIIPEVTAGGPPLSPSLHGDPITQPSSPILRITEEEINVLFEPKIVIRPEDLSSDEKNTGRPTPRDRE